MVIEILRYMVKNIMIDKHLSTRKLFNMRISSIIQETAFKCKKIERKIQKN